MKISVVIPTYNAAKTIVPVVKAIIQQSLTPHEIIVVDDCSVDDTVQLVSNFKEITVHVLAKNYGGPAWPRNIGIELARGNFIALMRR